MWYILDKDNKPIESNIIEYSEWEEKNPELKTIKQDYIGDIFVSTVFLGLDHKPWFSDVNDEHILWETMIFNGEHDQYQERYTSIEEAIKGHETALKLVNQEL